MIYYLIYILGYLLYMIGFKLKLKTGSAETFDPIINYLDIDILKNNIKGCPYKVIQNRARSKSLHAEVDRCVAMDMTVDNAKHRGNTVCTHARQPLASES